jgi:hypothetical protein
MSRYGWTQGTGLGADESGIVNPLRVQVDKRRKKADADGGGWAEPGGKGKIIGGARKNQRGNDDGDGSGFGSMSEVIVLRNMLENMPDLQEEIEQGLGQEIGEECGEKVRSSKLPGPRLPGAIPLGRVLVFARDKLTATDTCSTAASRDYTSIRPIARSSSNSPTKCRHYE